MFGYDRPITQTYDQALEVVANGGATLEATYTESSPVKNAADFAHQLYVMFGELAPKHMQEFICGPFGNWDGTSSGMFYDGMIFGVARQPFIDALQHHRSDDGARYIWAFLLVFRGVYVVSPLYEKADYSYINWADGTTTEYTTQEEARKVWETPEEGRRSMGGSYRIVRKEVLS